MGKMYEGKLLAEGLTCGIVVSRFNEFITSKLLSGAMDCLIRHGADNKHIDIIWVPGAFEIPLAAQHIMEKYDAVICLGTIIRGSTPHFDYIASEVTKGVAQVGLTAKKPIINGILTVDTIEQAIGEVERGIFY